MSTTPRFDAWLQMVIGGGLFVIGVATLLDPSARVIKIGFIIAGPFLAFRGFHALKAEAQNAAQLSLLPTYEIVIPPDDHDLGGADPDDGSDIDALATRPDSQHVQVACEACREAYVYFPDATASAREVYLREGLCVAPCPKCGRVQQDMIELARKMGYLAFAGGEWAYRGVLMLVGSGLFFVFNVAKMAFAGGGPADSSQWIYWSANLVLFLAGLGCVVAGYVAANRLPDPNRVPLERRLRRGQWMGMSLVEYDAIRNGQGLDESK